MHFIIKYITKKAFLYKTTIFKRFCVVKCENRFKFVILSYVISCNHKSFLITVPFTLINNITTNG
ncbi:hypothetical protein M2273_001299 [Mucilaginibacter lappiensis]